MTDKQQFLTVGDGTGWGFLNGTWSDGDAGELIPPDGFNIEYMAVRDRQAYGDFTARFRFKFRSVSGGARFLFRMSDARRFYALDIPACGQQFRSRHFWAGIVIADGGPLQRYLNFGLVPGLCARIEHWYEARVQAQGPRLRAWINDLPVADVLDHTYASGCIGLASIANPYLQTAHYQGLRIEGEAAPAAAWPGIAAPRPHWITPCPQPEPGTFQSYASLIQSQSGQVTLYLTLGDPNVGETRRAVYLRSGDGGRHWSQPEPATLAQGLGGPFVRRDGAWVCVFANHPIVKQSPLYSYQSSDEGRTWSGPTALTLRGEWPKRWRASAAWRPVRMGDGALVLPIMATLVDEPRSPAAAPFWACLVLRSEDDGQTWSAPVQCDSNHLVPGQPLSTEMGGGLVHAARYFEVAIADAGDNTVIGIGRPERDPYMWSLRSNDGGVTWEPGAWGHFPGYCPSLTRTASGALVATTRFPYFAAHLSRDAGRTWEPPVIVDYCTWANQQALEVEPDVVLLTYMGAIMEPGKADSRIARLRVTEQGLRLDH